MPEQLSFDLSVRPALGREDFFVSTANANALAMLDAREVWPNGKLLLTGPAGAGKTHLAHVWASEAGATVLPAGALLGLDIDASVDGPFCVEDVHLIAGDREAETQLFHVHNLALARGHALLLTARAAPARWGMVLPDLVSRLQGTTLVQIEAPDDALLGALYSKLFADRQLSPQPDVIPYLATNAPRSFDAAAEIVEDLDKAALSLGRRLTRDLARGVLARRTEAS